MASADTATAEGSLRRARRDLESGLRRGADDRVESYLAAYPALAADAEAAIELVYTEFVVRQELGQTPTPKEWYDRFPQWKDDLEQMFQVHDVLCQSAPPAPGKSRAGSAAVPFRDAGPVRIPGYEILDELGRGGMGVVFRARDTMLNRTAAVKVILSGDLAGQKERERFRREAEAAARLDHPNIVRVYEVGEHDSRPYCAMEYVGGGSLAARMTGSPWPAATAAALLAEIARAADHAHQRGVVHRDLKPANILLATADLANAATRSAVREPRSEFLPKIVDFGLAKCLSDSNPTLTRAGDVVGTPMYMAPEQAAGHGAVGPAADVWALGVVLYELLTGLPPFRGDSAEETLHQVRTAEPVPPRKLRAKLPPDLDTICLRCLQKEPHRRYASAAALAEDLERWARGAAILARPIRWPEIAAKWARREPVVAGLTAGLAAVALAGFAGVLWQWQRADKQRDDAVRAGRIADDAREEAVRVSGLEADAREAAEAQLYASHIARAAHDLAASRTASAERLLDNWKAREPDRCRWEWDYLKRQCRTHLLELAGHTQPVNSVAYSPDGRLIATGGGVWNSNSAGEVRVWDAETGSLRCDLRGPTRNVHRVAFHPAGTEVLAACGDGTVYRWDVRAADKPLPAFKCGNGQAYAAAYHPNGRMVAVAGGDGSVQFWDVAGGRRLARRVWHTHNVYDVAYSPDGKYFASTCRDGAVVIRDTTDYHLVHELRLVGDARKVRFSPDGRLMATQSFDGEIVLWDMADGFRRAGTRHVGSGNGHDLTFRPDGRFLACATRDADLKLWYVRGLEQASAVGAGSGSALAVTFSPDALRLAVSSHDDNVVRVWDSTAEPEPRVVSWNDMWIPSLAVSPDGKTLAFAGGLNQSHNNGSKVVRLTTDAGAEVASLAGHAGWLTAVVYHPGGRQLASADEIGAAILWDLGTRRPTHTLLGHDGPIHAMAYTSDGRTLATAGADRTVRFWNTADGTEAATLTHPAAVLAVAVSTDGRLLATGSDDKIVRIWDVVSRTVRHTLTGHRAPVNALAFRPGSDELVSADENHDLRFWAAETGRDRTVRAAQPAAPTAIEMEEDRPAKAVARPGSSLAYAADGRRLLFGSTSRPVQVWDADARRPLLDLAVPNYHHKQSVAFHPDGRRVITATRGRVFFWDASFIAPEARRAAAAARGPAWHRAQAEADSLAGYFAACEFHADRSAAAEPWDPMSFARRGEARAARGRAADAAADHARALALAAIRAAGTPGVPGDGQIWLYRGEAAAHAGLWPEAAAACRFALLHEPDELLHGTNLASALLMAGSTAEYATVCRALARRCADRPSTEDAMAFHAVLPLRDGLTPDEWVKFGARAQAARGAFSGPASAAAALYRAGRYADAARTFPGFSEPRAWEMLFRAKTCHRLGQVAEARRWLTRARVWIAEADRIEGDPTAWGNTRWMHWNEKGETRALLREAEELLAVQS